MTGVTVMFEMEHLRMFPNSKLIPDDTYIYMFDLTKIFPDRNCMDQTKAHKLPRTQFKDVYYKINHARKLFIRTTIKFTLQKKQTIKVTDILFSQCDGYADVTFSIFTHLPKGRSNFFTSPFSEQEVKPIGSSVS